MLNKRLSDFGARNLRTRVPKGSALKTTSLFKMWPLEWDGGRVRQTRSFDWKNNEERTREVEVLGATWPLCRGMPYGIVAYRQDKVTHSRFRLIGLTSA